MTRTDDFTVYRFIIIGGGAAGLYAGAIAGFFHPDLPEKHCGLILERGTEPGRKLIITGSGQCNLTHSGSIKDFPAHYHEAGRKIRTLLYAHSNQRVVSTFSDMGIKTFEREDGKIFPESLSARKVRDTLSERCSKNGFPILTGMKCTELIPLHRKSINRGARWKIICGEQEFRARNVLVTTGGASVPKTGSDGSFLKILERLTIPVSPLTPALVPVSVQRYPFRDLSGISFPNAGITVFDRSGKKKTDRRGPLLLTHEAFSGPCIIDSSRYVETGDRLEINWIGSDSTDILLHRLHKKAEKSKSFAVSHMAETLKESGFIVPQRFLDLQFQRCGADPARKASQTGSKIWALILRILTEDTFSVSGKGGFSSSMVTKGGISLDAVNLRTMESRQYPGLFFAGEVLDVDGDTGGYNLQFAFSSSACAVKNIFSAV